MLIIKKKTHKKYRGSGLFDSLISAVTSTAVSNAAKEVATTIAKKAVTYLGTKATEKVIDKIFPKENKNSKLTPKGQELLDNILARGKSI